MATNPEKVEQINGTVKTLTFVNADTGFFVARVIVPGMKHEQTVTGVAPSINEGEQISAEGQWATSNWGPQFKATAVTLSTPTMVEGIEKYLASSVEGIGKGYAKKLVAAFGEDVFHVIENNPERLSAVPGIGKKRAASIVEAYKSQRAIREIMVFLHKSGLSATRAVRVHKRYGDKAIELIKENPYRLCQDVWGVGFKIADAVAQRQGIGRTSEYRLRAGIHQVLRDAEGQGSCGLPVDRVLEKASELLQVDYELLNGAIELELESEGLVRDVSASGDQCLFLPKIHQAERAIAEFLLAHSRRTPARPVRNIDEVLDHAQVDMDVVLDAVQLDAARAALANQVTVITGGPGCGKTTLTRVLLEVFDAAGLTYSLAAPTGKAAKRAAEATGREAKTLHRLLEFGPDKTFKRNAQNPLDADVVVIDEFSMVDVAMMQHVIKAIAGRTRLLMVGDVDQLPSVGAGKVLADVIESGALPTARLKTVFRQAAESQIIRNAHAVNRGEMPVEGLQANSDFQFLRFDPKDRNSERAKSANREAMAKEVVRMARDMYKLGYDPVRDVQVLCPMRRGALGTQEMNVHLQQALNPMPSASIEAMDTRWCVGDKVMQLRNNYEKDVFNGDIGFIKAIDTADKTLVVDIDGRDIVYKTSELDELTLAYAFTIHKSQGSEFPVVIMPFDGSHYMMLKRNLVYTGITRARKLCVVLGDNEALKRAVRTAQNDERYSRLKACLQQAMAAQLKGAKELVPA